MTSWPLAPAKIARRAPNGDVLGAVASLERELIAVKALRLGQ
jgi:hypothetical protein